MKNVTCVCVCVRALQLHPSRKDGNVTARGCMQSGSYEAPSIIHQRYVPIIGTSLSDKLYLRDTR